MVSSSRRGRPILAGTLTALLLASADAGLPPPAPAVPGCHASSAFSSGWKAHEARTRYSRTRLTTGEPLSARM
jgi:hypothetical protein